MDFLNDFCSTFALLPIHTVSYGHRKDIVTKILKSQTNFRGKLAVILIHLLFKLQIHDNTMNIQFHLS